MATKTITIKVSDSTYRSLKLISAIEHKTYSEITTAYLEEIVNRILAEHTKCDMWLNDFLSMDKETIDLASKDDSSLSPLI